MVADREAYECGNIIDVVFKQKTADEMRISDWSSDVCSSDLACRPSVLVLVGEHRQYAQACRSEQPQRRRLLRPCLLQRRWSLRRMSGGGKIGRASCRESVCQYV